jgi:hypothetical protein
MTNLRLADLPCLKPTNSLYNIGISLLLWLHVYSLTCLHVGLSPKRCSFIRRYAPQWTYPKQSQAIDKMGLYLFQSAVCPVSKAFWITVADPNRKERKRIHSKFQRQLANLGLSRTASAATRISILTNWYQFQTVFRLPECQLQDLSKLLLPKFKRRVADALESAELFIPKSCPSY